MGLAKDSTIPPARSAPAACTGGVMTTAQTSTISMRLSVSQATWSPAVQLWVMKGVDKVDFGVRKP